MFASLPQFNEKNFFLQIAKTVKYFQRVCSAKTAKRENIKYHVESEIHGIL